MKFSNIFFNNSSFAKDNTSLNLVDLTKKACFFNQDSSGIYSTLSLGYILEKKIERIIEEELSEIGFSQMRLSLIQDADLWKETGRYDQYGEELFKLKNRTGKELVLSATCEESITNIVKSYYNFTKTNLKMFQIGNKYRDELRAKSGLVRGREFLMSDAYHFSNSKDNIVTTYNEVREAYTRIFSRLGLEFHIQGSDVGEMGGLASEEFRCISEFGEDIGEDGSKNLEIGHIFNLGTHYSEKMGLLDNIKQHVNMACFGIGVSRTLMALLEKQRDDKGFFGTAAFNTFDYIVTAIDYEKNKEVADSIYQSLKRQGYTVLLDDRNVSAGNKFNDSELIGVSNRIIVSNKSIVADQFDVLNRETNTAKTVTLEQLNNL